eukprot:CAMPEP_0195033198 /NCGR_PEP_ID=MMETSP0326_2-20130528/65025_1 /TAXON_ID=2866 ORGANISM="Crypthecodinium cohnii, Strain Seligo" /NCGR_SAMPLE_ID=MMETSP0326_2 /ASSEMBLY_ACC=CAM_ASM_000348 /LENGTH=105 /DNA_ID=CAMNT_0040057545 /DNA_START=136 /DNA_END=453 /DNA_ORIENTATION=+
MRRFVVWLSSSTENSGSGGGGISGIGWPKNEPAKLPSGSSSPGTGEGGGLKCRSVSILPWRDSNALRVSFLASTVNARLTLAGFRFTSREYFCLIWAALLLRKKV